MFVLKDCLYWPFSKDGNYSVKSGYSVLKNFEVARIVKPSSSYINSEVSWRAIWELGFLVELNSLFGG